MADFIYRRHQQPGCGGCFFLFILLLLLSGGAPLVLNLLGVLFSFFIGFLLLGVIAFWGFGYYVRRAISRYEQSQTEVHNRFVTLLVNILVKVAQTDGEVSRDEVNIIMNFFRTNLRYNQAQMFWVKELTKEALDSNIPLERLLSEFRGQFAHEPRVILLELVYQLIFTKSQPLQTELDLARRIGDYLQIPPYEQQAIFGKYRTAGSRRAMDSEHYYRVLGLQPGAGFAEIKTAYRKLSMQYHPDKVAHLGDEFKQVAEEKMKEINAAYQHLKERFG